MVEVLGDGVGLVRRGGDVGVETPVGHRDVVVTAERRLPGEHLVGQDAERVQVGAAVGVGAGDLLGGEVGGGAHHHAAGGGAGLGDGADQPEVGEFDGTVGGDQDVLRFDVAVHQPGVVRLAKGAEQGA